MSIISIFLIILLVVLLFRVSVSIIRFLIKAGIFVLFIYLCYKLLMLLAENFQL
ncbi:hypothetical protein [Staphylococcus chromogenes]|uniref:hypothetical protein n=1 Tax=Staphylococcus chromogenes TaxID=46126 RepID=UPI00398B35D8